MKTIALPPYSEISTSNLNGNALYAELPTQNNLTTDLLHYYTKTVSRMKYRTLRLAASVRSRKIGRLIGLSAIYIMGFAIVALQLRSIL